MRGDIVGGNGDNCHHHQLNLVCIHSLFFYSPSSGSSGTTGVGRPAGQVRTQCRSSTVSCCTYAFEQRGAPSATVVVAAAAAAAVSVVLH